MKVRDLLNQLKQMNLDHDIVIETDEGNLSCHFYVQRGHYDVYHGTLIHQNEIDSGLREIDEPSRFVEVVVLSELCANLLN